MLDPTAILVFADKQKRLLRRLYDEAWQRGVDSYEPDNDPTQEPPTPREWALIGLTGMALLAARRQYAYIPPGTPDQLRRALVLAPSFAGVNSMAAQLGSLISGAAPQIIDPAGAVAAWVDSNAWRLDAGASVAWAGEQTGYAEAADADGQLLFSWTSVGDTHVCSDCELLSSFPAMPLSEWPTVPGAGDTACNVGCRCSWDTWGAPLPTDISQLTANQSDLVSILSDRQAQALADLMPDAAYLEQ